MSLPDNADLSNLACQTVVQIAQKSLQELFLGQLPSLFDDRVSYLSMVNEQF